jgi:hypothetical protein
VEWTSVSPWRQAADSDAAEMDEEEAADADLEQNKAWYSSA